MLDHTTVDDVRYVLTSKGKAALLDAAASEMELFDLCQHSWQLASWRHNGKRVQVLRCETCDDSRPLPRGATPFVRSKE